LRDRPVWTAASPPNPNPIAFTGFGDPLLEDDFVGDLRYDGRALPALKALDPCGRVLDLI
jgi:hypothetical protein